MKKDNPVIVNSYLSFKNEQLLKNKNGVNYFWKYFFDKKNAELINLLNNKRPRSRSNLFNINDVNNLKKIII